MLAGRWLAEYCNGNGYIACYTQRPFLLFMEYSIITTANITLTGYES